MLKEMLIKLHFKFFDDDTMSIFNTITSCVCLRKIKGSLFLGLRHSDFEIIEICFKFVCRQLKHYVLQSN